LSLHYSDEKKYLFTGCLTAPDSTFNWFFVLDTTGEVLIDELIFFDSIAQPTHSTLIAAENGDYLFSGEIYFGGQRDLLCRRYSATGELLLQKTWGSSGDEFHADFISTDDSGFLLAATTNSEDLAGLSSAGGSDVWLLKLDALFETGWSQLYGGERNDYAAAILSFSNGYLVGASSQSADGMVSGHHGSTDYYDFWVFRLSDSGGMLWNQSFGGSKDDFLSGLVKADDTSFVFSGSTYSSDGQVEGNFSTPVFGDQWTIQTDTSGQLLWQKCTGGNRDDWSSAVTRLNAGEYVIAGGSISSSGEFENGCFTNDCNVISGGWMVKLNEDCPAYPSADFEFSQEEKKFSFTNQSINAISYHWDFGDGTTGTETDPQHLYTLHGNYQVCLLAIDTCSTKINCTTVSTCTAPVVAGFTFILAGASYAFTDQSLNAAQWLWDFGDGNFSTEQNPVHDFAGDGTFTVWLLITDSCGNTDSSSQLINTCAGFSAAFTYAGNFNTLSFFDQSLGDAEQFSWAFGDGNFSDEQHPVHTYNAAGEYEVCLITSNAVCGSDTVCQSLNIVCAPFEASFAFLQVADTVFFEDQSVNSLSWLWNFGDGNSSTEKNPVHHFGDTGVFISCLTVYDGCTTDTACDTIEIYAVPVAGNKTVSLFATIQPNPAGDWATLVIKNALPVFCEIRLQDAWSRTLSAFPAANLPAGESRWPIDLSRYVPGVYTVKIVAGYETATLKLVVN
jgi:PKD repeat protein